MAEPSGMRQLTQADGPAFVELLARVYGDSYSYRDLYQPGGVGRLLASGKVSMWGDFLQDGRLASHTAFLHKDRRGEFVESGMSLRNSAVRPVTSDAVVWANLWQWAAQRWTLIHQNTTTWHTLAQRYAEQHMAAVTTGLVFDYVIGERLLQLQHREGPMHVVTMSSALVSSDATSAREQKRLVVPAGRWSEFVAGVIDAAAEHSGVFNDRVTDAFVQQPITSFGLEVTEHNAAIELTRRELTLMGSAIAAPAPISRTDLIHVAMDERVFAVPTLEAFGWVVVGVRPCFGRPDELILQYLPGQQLAAAVASSSAMRLTTQSEQVVQLWRKAVARR